MRKMLTVFFVSFVLLAGVMPVQAQGILRGGYMPSSPEGWYYYFRGDQVHMLQADTMNWVGETMNIGRRAQFRRVTDDLIGYGSYVGLRGPRGFYPMYQCSSTGRRWERGIGTTLITTAIGAAVAGKKGALIGAGVGGGYALYKDSSCRQPVQNNQIQIVGLENDGQTMIVQPPMTQMPPGRPNNGWNERLRNQANAGGNSWFGSQRGCQEQGMFTLKNESGEAIRVFQNGQPFAVLQSRQSECGDPFAEYDAEMVVAVSDGFTARAQIVRAKPEGRQGGIWVWR